MPHLSRPGPRRILTLLTAATASCLATGPDDPIPDHDSILLESRATEEERRINVCLPVGYAEAVDRRYPVLYMPDGGIAEDFPHISNTILALTEAGAIEPHIVVGIENTQRQRDLTGPTEIESDKKLAARVGGSAAFRTFLRDELRPEIERRYRCDDRTAIIGESLAGLFVTETFLLEPTMFDRYIAVSPSLWWNDHSLLEGAAERIAAHDGRGSVLYLTSADETDIFPHTDRLAELLEAQAPSDLKWSYTPRRDLHHHTIFRSVKEDAFRKVLWAPPPKEPDRDA